MDTIVFVFLFFVFLKKGCLLSQISLMHFSSQAFKNQIFVLTASLFIGANRLLNISGTISTPMSNGPSEHCTRRSVCIKLMPVQFFFSFFFLKIKSSNVVRGVTTGWPSNLGLKLKSLFFQLVPHTQVDFKPRKVWPRLVHFQLLQPLSTFPMGTLASDVWWSISTSSVQTPSSLSAFPTSGKESLWCILVRDVEF